MEILIPLEGPTPSGLQAKELMGLTVYSINELSDSDVQNFNKFYEELYLRAYRALVVDLQKILSGFYTYPDGTRVAGRFQLNKKLLAIDTSVFTKEVVSVAPAVTVQSSISEYSALSVDWAEIVFNTPGVVSPPLGVSIQITDNNTAKVVYTSPVYFIDKPVQAIRLPIYFNLFWETNFTVQVIYDGAPPEILTTSQKYYTDGQWIKEAVSCRCPCGNGDIVITQTTPGLNVHLSGFCSIERFVERNFPMLKFALYYSIGREFMKDRVTSDRINQYTVLTIDRATQLLEIYEKDYINSLDCLRDIHSIQEDAECFACKKAVYSNNLLP
jgi:hypothetical protein